MSKPSGNKYHRKIKSVEDIAGFTTADVYSVLEAFDVSCPARQHAIKKLLCSGIRGKGDTMQDLTEARDAVDRAIVLEKQRTKFSMNDVRCCFQDEKNQRCRLGFNHEGECDFP